MVADRPQFSKTRTRAGGQALAREPPPLPEGRIDIGTLELRQCIYELALGGPVVSMKLVAYQSDSGVRTWHYWVHSKCYAPCKEAAADGPIRLRVPIEGISIALISACRQVHELKVVVLAALGHYCLPNIRSVYLFHSYHRFRSPRWIEMAELLRQMCFDNLTFEFELDVPRVDLIHLELQRPVLAGYWSGQVVTIRNLRRFELFFTAGDPPEHPTDVAQRMRNLMIGPEADERYRKLLERTQAERSSDTCPQFNKRRSHRSPTIAIVLFLAWDETTVKPFCGRPFTSMTPRITSSSWVASRPFRAMMVAELLLVYSAVDILWGLKETSSTSALNRIVAELRPTFAVLPLLIAIVFLFAAIYDNVSPRDGEGYLEVNTAPPMDLAELEPTLPVTLHVGISISLLTVGCSAGIISIVSFWSRVPWSRTGRFLENLPALQRRNPIQEIDSEIILDVAPEEVCIECNPQSMTPLASV
ncbi:hypothetical protein FB451DRAFT_1166285 [Mycena latifolia]|nr:hypothetical protein FB451DRAFT_1166285 [Mycena latifolia]